VSYSEISDKWITTRKPHRCEWCDEQIEAGTKARRRVYVLNGDLADGRMHPECYAASLTLEWFELEDGWTPGDYARGSAESTL